MKEKVIHKEQLQLEEEEKTRLSYNMVFDKSHDELDRETRQLLERTKSEWENKLIKERQQAIEEGYQAGYNDGYAKAREEIEQQLTPVKQALDETNGRISSFAEDIKPALTSLIFEMAEKVISVPVENQELRENVANAIHQWIERLRNDQKITIEVAESDREAVNELVDKQEANLKITTSPELNPGEFRIENNHQAIIQEFKRHLAALRSSAEVKEALNPPDV